MSTPFEKLVFSNYLYVLLMSAQLSSNLTLLLGGPRHSKAHLVSRDAELLIELHRARKRFFNAYCRLSSNTRENKLMVDMLQGEQKISIDHAPCLFEGTKDFQEAIVHLTRAYQRARDEQPKLAKQLRSWIETRPAWISPKKSYASSKPAFLHEYNAQPKSIRRILRGTYVSYTAFNTEFFKIAEPGNCLDVEFFSDILEATPVSNTESKVRELYSLALAVNEKHPGPLTRELAVKLQGLASTLKVKVAPLREKGKV